MSDNQGASKNYKDTVFLPTTAFPMRRRTSAKGTGNYCSLEATRSLQKT